MRKISYAGYRFPPQVIGEAARSGDSLPRLSATRVSTSAASAADDSQVGEIRPFLFEEAQLFDSETTANLSIASRPNG
jgi:hypothetical protein